MSANVATLTTTSAIPVPARDAAPGIGQTQDPIAERDVPADPSLRRRATADHVPTSATATSIARPQAAVPLNDIAVNTSVRTITTSTAVAIATRLQYCARPPRRSHEAPATGTARATA